MQNYSFKSHISNFYSGNNRVIHKNSKKLIDSSIKCVIKMIISIRKINIWAMIGFSSENLPISEN